MCWPSILVSLANAPRCRYVLKHMDNSRPSCSNRYSQIIPYLSLIKEDFSANRYKNWRFLSKFVSIHQKERKILVKAMPIYQDFPSNAFPAFVLRKMKNPQLTMAKNVNSPINGVISIPPSHLLSIIHLLN